MKIGTDNIVSLSEANRNFSRVARLVDDAGAVVILRNNAPSYFLTTFEQATLEQKASDKDALDTVCRIAGKAQKELGAAAKSDKLIAKKAGVP